MLILFSKEQKAGCEGGEKGTKVIWRQENACI